MVKGEEEGEEEEEEEEGDERERGKRLHGQRHNSWRVKEMEGSEWPP